MPTSRLRALLLVWCLLRAGGATVARSAPGRRIARSGLKRECHCELALRVKGLNFGRGDGTEGSELSGRKSV